MFGEDYVRAVQQLASAYDPLVLFETLRELGKEHPDIAEFVLLHVCPTAPQFDLGEHLGRMIRDFEATRSPPDIHAIREESAEDIAVHGLFLYLTHEIYRRDDSDPQRAERLETMMNQAQATYKKNCEQIKNI